MGASDRVSLDVTDKTVVIHIDGAVRYIGGVEELKNLLEQHRKLMDYIDSHEEDE